ncbi:hypothetical protein GOP47_0004111 [Adiantum capillus-veneris]|uniref:Uncharacterized protein n=1 Tax=Adiantum capillus-veneris TaxID=13818 RepID=A0A9D4V874_ADICA|nr:hypothetical protein GOP47_0004111 [Adiantum capillus-veneris]
MVGSLLSALGSSPSSSSNLPFARNLESLPSSTINRNILRRRRPSGLTVPPRRDACTVPSLPDISHPTPIAHPL